MQQQQQQQLMGVLRFRLISILDFLLLLQHFVVNYRIEQKLPQCPSLASRPLEFASGLYSEISIQDCNPFQGGHYPA
jgi:hypothetical protein